MMWSIKKNTEIEIEIEQEQLEKLMRGEEIRDWINVALQDVEGRVNLMIYCSNPIETKIQ